VVVRARRETDGTDITRDNLPIFGMINWPQLAPGKYYRREHHAMWRRTLAAIEQFDHRGERLDAGDRGWF
jgi:hypothetical protein